MSREEKLTSKSHQLKISDIKDEGIRVLALRNLSNQFGKYVPNKSTEDLSDYTLTGAFSFGRADEPYELQADDKVKFWVAVSNGEEDKAMGYIKDYYKSIKKEK